MLEIRNAFKAYGEKQILENFSLRLPESGIVAILGPSGCGKTTLLRVIAGLEKLDGGKVLMPESAKISMVFQEDRLLNALDVRGNVLAALSNKDSDMRLADECLSRCGLQDVAKQRVSSLSGGMKRRVAIARAVAFDGDILLLDEPFKGLDDELKKTVMDFVFEKSDSRLTVFITHDAEEAARSAGTVLRFFGPPLMKREDCDEVFR